MAQKKNEDIKHVVDSLQYIANQPCGEIYLNDVGQAINYIDSSTYIEMNQSFGPFTMHRGNRKETCTCCKVLKEVSMSYTPYKDTRYICAECSQDAFDKMFGIDNKTEKVLFGPPVQKPNK